MPTLGRVTGSGTGGNWKTSAPYDKMTRARAQVLKDTIDLLLASSLPSNLFVGGSENLGVPATATGDKTLYEFVPWMADNRSNRLTGFTDANGATLVVQVRFLLRVSNAAISITPKIWYGSTMDAITTAATYSGAAACSATNSDYSGTNQIQTVALTLPNGLKYFKAGFTIAGTPAADYQAFARAYYDAYVSLP